jgi:hypothetical protein
MHARVNRCPHPSDAKGWPWPMNVSPVSNAASWPVWWPEDERLRGIMAASHAALVQAMAAAGLRQRPRLHLAQGPGGEGLAPSGPPIAQRRSALHAHVPSPTRSAGGARRVVAAWGSAGSSLASPGGDLALAGHTRPHGCPKDPRLFKRSVTSPRPNGVVPNSATPHIIEFITI